MLMPFAGIAFLWFIGVVRDGFGSFEDKFFSTVFIGSGLLFLAMMFVSSAVGAGLVASQQLRHRRRPPTARWRRSARWCCLRCPRRMRCGWARCS